MTTVYLVWNKNKTECVGFTDRENAEQAAGVKRLQNPCSTLAEAWRETYADDEPKLKFRIEPVDPAQIALMESARDARNDEISHQQNLRIEAQDFAEELRSKLTTAQLLIKRAVDSGALSIPFQEELEAELCEFLRAVDNKKPAEAGQT